MLTYTCNYPHNHTTEFMYLPMYIKNTFHVEIQNANLQLVNSLNIANYYYMVYLHTYIMYIETYMSN